MVLEVKNLPANTGDVGSIPRLGRSPGGGNGYPLQYSCLENLMDRGAWRATVHGHRELDTTEWLSIYTYTLVSPYDSDLKITGQWQPGEKSFYFRILDFGFYTFCSVNMCFIIWIKFCLCFLLRKEYCVLGVDSVTVPAHEHVTSPC